MTLKIYNKGNLPESGRPAAPLGVQLFYHYTEPAELVTPVCLETPRQTEKRNGYPDKSHEGADIKETGN